MVSDDVWYKGFNELWSPFNEFFNLLLRMSNPFQWRQPTCWGDALSETRPYDAILIPVQTPCAPPPQPSLRQPEIKCDVTAYNAMFTFVTARVRSTREGNMYTWKCVYVHHWWGRGLVPHPANRERGYSTPGPGGGVPHLGDRGYPISDLDGVPIPGPGGGYPIPGSGTGAGTPFQFWMRGGPLLFRPGMGNPLSWTWDRYPLHPGLEGVPPSQDWMGIPPPPQGDRAA